MVCKNFFLVSSVLKCLIISTRHSRLTSSVSSSKNCVKNSSKSMLHSVVIGTINLVNVRSHSRRFFDFTNRSCSLIRTHSSFVSGLSSALKYGLKLLCGSVWNFKCWKYFNVGYILLLEKWLQHWHSLTLKYLQHWYSTACYLLKINGTWHSLTLFII